MLPNHLLIADGPQAAHGLATRSETLPAGSYEHAGTLRDMESHAVFRPIGQVSLHQAVEMVTSAIGFAQAQNIRKLLVITSDLTGFEPPTITTPLLFRQGGRRLHAGPSASRWWPAQR
jgi:hypothetical protein